MEVVHVSDVVELMMSLMWPSVVLMHDEQPQAPLLEMLDSKGIYYVDYNTSALAGPRLHTVLDKAEDFMKPILNVLLMCNSSRSFEIIQQVERRDLLNPSTDLRHSSRFLVVVESSHNDWPLFYNTKVENFAYINTSSAEIWTLVFTPNGREFREVTSHYWPRLNSDDLFPNIKYGYNGRQIVAVMKHHKFMKYGTVQIGKMKVSGLTFRIFEELCLSLNFSYRVISPREEEWGRNRNGSWSGVIGMLQRREADILPELLTIHYERLQVIDYILPPVIENKRWILYQKQDFEDNLRVFVRPFHTYVFIAFFAAMLAHGFILSAVRFIQDDNKPSMCSSASGEGRYCMYLCTVTWSRIKTVDSLFECVGASLRQGTRRFVSARAERLLVASWWIFTIIISAIYCSAILAALTVKKERKPFNDVLELAASSEYKVGYDSSSVTTNLLNNATNKGAIAVKKRSQELSVTDPDVLSSNATRHLEKVRTEKYAFITGVLYVLYMTHTNCKLVAMDGQFGNSFSTFAVQKRSPYIDDLTKSMYKLRDGGILGKIRRKWLDSMPNDKCVKEPFPRPISLSKFYSIFYPVCTGLGCATCVLIVELLCGQRKSTKQE